MLASEIKHLNRTTGNKVALIDVPAHMRPENYVNPFQKVATATVSKVVAGGFLSAAEAAAVRTTARGEDSFFTFKWGQKKDTNPDELEKLRWDDEHVNAKGHQLIADLVFDKAVELGLTVGGKECRRTGSSRRGVLGGW